MTPSGPERSLSSVRWAKAPSIRTFGARRIDNSIDRSFNARCEVIPGAPRYSVGANAVKLPWLLRVQILAAHLTVRPLLGCPTDAFYDLRLGTGLFRENAGNCDRKLVPTR